MPPFNKLLLWLGIAAGSLLSLVIVVYLTMFLFTSGVKKAIDNQLAAIRAEDTVLAYSYTTKAFQEITSLENFKKFINAYSGLRNNKSIAYKERETTNGITVVHAILISRGGSETPVRYQLIKENGQWKIQGMVINPDDDEKDKNASATDTKNLPVTTPQAETETPQAVVLTNYYQDPKYGYSVRYPSDWQFTTPHRGVVVFRGPNNTPAYASTITLQTTKFNRRRSVQQVIDETKSIIARQSSQMQVIDSGIIPSLPASSMGLQARYTVYSYTLNNQDFGLLAVIYYTNPDRALYVLDYATPASQFQADLPIAKSMTNSFFGK